METREPPELPPQNPGDQSHQAESPEAASATSATGNAGGEHLDGIVLPPDAGEGGPGAEPLGSPVEAGGFLSRDAWIEVFCQCHKLAGAGTGLRTLSEAASRPETIEAGGAIYDTCRETAALHWLIKPGSVWLQRLGAIGAYGLVVGAGVRAELQERRAGKGAGQGAAPAATAPAAESSASFKEEELARQTAA